MLKIQVCVGSSCHLKGSYAIVERFTQAIEAYNLADKVNLAGSFCIGKCNREGVTVQINDDIYPGVTVEKFDAFFKEHVLDVI